jgi:hypothetical protein
MGFPQGKSILYKEWRNMMKHEKCRFTGFRNFPGFRQTLTIAFWDKPMEMRN